MIHIDARSGICDKVVYIRSCRQNLKAANLAGYGPNCMPRVDHQPNQGIAQDKTYEGYCKLPEPETLDSKP